MCHITKQGCPALWALAAVNVPYNPLNLRRKWAGLRSWYSDWLRAGRSGDRIPVGARFSAPVQTVPGAYPTYCTMRTESFPGIKSGRGVTLTPPPLLVPSSWKSRAMPLFPLWAVRPVQSLSACTSVHFTVTFTQKACSIFSNIDAISLHSQQLSFRKVPWGSPSLLYNGYRVFPGGKVAGTWRWSPTPSSAEVKERVELYHYSTSGPSWSVIWWTLPLLYPVLLVWLSCGNHSRI